MTDLATKSEADGPTDPSARPVDGSTTTATAVLDASAVPPSGDAPVQWAPAEPKPRPRRLWLWIGVPAALVAAGAVAASLVLIAPGTSVAGVPVGLQTAGAASDAINARLSETTLTLGEGGPTVTGADLGATVDAKALADTAFGERPMWNVSQWFGAPLDAPITLDAAKADAALRAALPSAYTDPIPAKVSFDGASYVVTPEVSGTGVDVDAVAAQLHDAFAAGESGATVTLAETTVDSPATTEKAQAAADGVNAMLAGIGFYVDTERTVPVDAATAASWLTVAPDATGAFTVTADATKIQPMVDGLAAAVNRAPANGAVVTDSAGTVLETITPGADGRVLGDVSNVAADFARQLDSGNAAYALPVEVTPAVMAASARMVEVDLSEQMLYMKENGAVVDSWPISSGIAESPSTVGHHSVQSHHRVQTMSSTSATDSSYSSRIRSNSGHRFSGTSECT